MSASPPEHDMSVTDWRSADDALRNSEALYHSLVDVLPQSIFRKDAAGRFTFANKKLCELVGKRLDEIVGKTDHELYPRELAEKYRRDDQRVLATGESFETVEENVTPQGARFFVRVVKSPVKDAQGNVVGVQGIFWDETERRQMEETLRESEELFRKLSESSPLGIALMDTQGHCTYTNLRYRAIFGVTFMESLGEGWTRWFYPEDRARVRSEWFGAIRERREFACEFRLQLRPGTVRWVHLRSSAMRDDRGGVRGHAATVEDITERKQAEAAQREIEARKAAILESALDAFVTIDHEGRIVEFNPAAERMFGYTCAEVAGKPAAELIVPRALHDAYRQELARFLDGSASSVLGKCIEMPGLRHDGAEFPVEVAVARISKEGPPMFTAYIRDITNRKRAEEQLQITTERLQILSRRLMEVQETERRAIARELHDEIGQALTATKINLQTALRFPDPATMTRTLQDSIELVSSLLQQVRNLSLALHAPMLDDLGLVAALRWYVDQQAQRAGLRAQCAADPSLPRLDAAVETACFRVTQEAITNVLRHAQAQTVVVELRRETDVLHLIVRDDGIGFEPAGLQGRAAEGLSLGWLSMQERAALVEGRLKCESAPGQGTAVHGYFPLILRSSETELTRQTEILSRPETLQPAVVSAGGA